MERDVSEQPEMPPLESPAPVDPVDAQPVEPPPAAPRPRPSRRNAWFAMGAVLVALLLLMFVPGSDDYDPNAPPPAAEPPGASAPAEGAALVGKPAPLDFTMKDMHGVDVPLSVYKGKVIVLNFWATWCGPCRAEIPDLVALQTQYRDDVVMLGVSLDEQPELIEPYADEFKINYPLLIGQGRADVLNAYGPLWGIPATFIIDRNGIVAKKHAGMATREQFEQELKPLIEQRAGAKDTVSDS